MRGGGGGGGEGGGAERGAIYREREIDRQREH